MPVTTMSLLTCAADQADLYVSPTARAQCCLGIADIIDYNRDLALRRVVDGKTPVARCGGRETCTLYRDDCPGQRRPLLCIDDTAF